MAEFVAKKFGRSFFASHVAALEPRNPQYEITTDPTTGKQSRKKRDMPLGLTNKEEKILRKVRKRAHRLDKGFSVCGFQFGWTAIIGLVPVFGDVVDASLSYFLIIRPARQCDIPMLLVERMLLNQAVSTTIGLVPFVGDLMMAVWKTNSRNAALFEDFLISRGQSNLEPRAPEAPEVAVPAAETTRLLENSKRPGYIDAKTGERGGKVATAIDVGSTPDTEPGPSTLPPAEVVSAASAPAVIKTPAASAPVVIKTTPVKSHGLSRVRSWFSRRKGAKGKRT